MQIGKLVDSLSVRALDFLASLRDVRLKLKCTRRLDSVLLGLFLEVLVQTEEDRVVSLVQIEKGGSAELEASNGISLEDTCTIIYCRKCEELR